MYYLCTSFQWKWPNAVRRITSGSQTCYPPCAQADKDGKGHLSYRMFSFFCFCSCNRVPSPMYDACRNIALQKNRAPENFNFWEEEEARQLYKLQSNEVIVSRFRRRRVDWVVESAALEMRCTHYVVPGVRIPHSPLKRLGASRWDAPISFILVSFCKLYFTKIKKWIVFWLFTYQKVAYLKKNVYFCAQIPI